MTIARMEIMAPPSDRAPKAAPAIVASYDRSGGGAASPASVRAMFDDIAVNYDRFNAWASLGLHQSWRKALIRRVPAGAAVLDIATGTGDLALLAAQKHEVVGVDFSERMLTRAREKDKAGRIRWILASADQLPLANGSFDCVASAFALRNLRSCLEDVFKETHRVLKAGGKVLHMDFGRPTSILSRWGHGIHLAVGIPFIGQWICGSHWPKGYLTNTIQEFYSPEEIENRLRLAGFSEVSHIPLWGGIVQLYEGIKC